MRRMSFRMTVEAMRQRTKTVTRRHPSSWANLKPGDLVTAVEKGQGISKGAKQVVLGRIRVVEVRVESLTLETVTPAEVEKEGFSGMEPLAFIKMLERTQGVVRGDRVRRIEFAHVFEPEIQLREKLEGYKNRVKLVDVLRAAENYLGRGQAFFDVARELMDEFAQERADFDRFIGV